MRTRVAGCAVRDPWYVGVLRENNRIVKDQNQQPHSRSPTRPDRDRYYRQHALRPRSGAGQAGRRLRCRPRGACPSSIAWKPPGRVSRVRGGYNDVGMPLGPLGPVAAPSPGGPRRVFARRRGSRIVDPTRSAGSRLLPRQVGGGRRLRRNRHHPLRLALDFRFNRANRTLGRRGAGRARRAGLLGPRQVRGRPSPRHPPPGASGATVTTRFVWRSTSASTAATGPSAAGVLLAALAAAASSTSASTSPGGGAASTFPVFRSQVRLRARAGAGFRLGTRCLLPLQRTVGLVKHRVVHPLVAEPERQLVGRQQHGLFHRRGPGRLLDLGLQLGFESASARRAASSESSRARPEPPPASVLLWDGTPSRACRASGSGPPGAPPPTRSAARRPRCCNTRVCRPLRPPGRRGGVRGPARRARAASWPGTLYRSTRSLDSVIHISTNDSRRPIVSACAPRWPASVVRSWT